MSGKKTKRRKRVYGLVAMVLVFCASLAVFASLASNAPQNSPQAQNDQNKAISSSLASLVTAEEALKTAMPIIEQYAVDNNLTVVTVNATLCLSVRDISAVRGNCSQSYPEWLVDADFETVNYIYGYSVLIWADNGEVRSAVPQGYM
jgi:hypothetical protein